MFLNFLKFIGENFYFNLFFFYLHFWEALDYLLTLLCLIYLNFLTNNYLYTNRFAGLDH